MLRTATLVGAALGVIGLTAVIANAAPAGSSITDFSAQQNPQKRQGQGQGQGNVNRGGGGGANVNRGGGGQMNVNRGGGGGGGGNVNRVQGGGGGGGGNVNRVQGGGGGGGSNVNRVQGGGGSGGGNVNRQGTVNQQGRRGGGDGNVNQQGRRGGDGSQQGNLNRRGGGNGNQQGNLNRRGGGDGNVNQQGNVNRRGGGDGNVNQQGNLNRRGGDGNVNQQGNVNRRGGGDSNVNRNIDANRNAKVIRNVDVNRGTAVKLTTGPGRVSTTTKFVHKGPTVVLAGNRVAPVWRGNVQRRLWWGGRWRVFAPVAALGVVAIGGAYFYPDAYLAVSRPYCDGLSPNGCQLNWQRVAFADGGDEWQCVQYCPRQGAIAPPKTVALVAPPPMPQQGSCEITIYPEQNFAGTAVTTSDEQPALSESGWQNQIASIQVKAGTWDLFSDEEFTGETLRLQPGQYADLGPEWTKKSGSFMCVQP